MTRHATDPLSLLAGLLFLALGAGYLLDGLDVWSADVTWVPPMVLLALGAGAVLAGTARARNDTRDDSP